MTQSLHFPMAYAFPAGFIWFLKVSAIALKASKQKKAAALTCGRVKTLQAPIPGQDTSHPTTTAHHPTAVRIWTWREPRASTAAAVFPTVCPAGLTGALLGPHAGR